MTVILVVYDVSDDRKRQRLSKDLERWGLARIQRSAFAGRMQPARARDLKRLVEKIIDRETDIVHIILLRDEEWARVEVIGNQWGEGVVPGAAVIQ
jgi:CRISPR-associated protein Cas2